MTRKWCIVLAKKIHFQKRITSPTPPNHQVSNLLIIIRAYIVDLCTKSVHSVFICGLSIIIWSECPIVFYPLAFERGKKRLFMIEQYERQIFKRYCLYMVGKITEKQFIFES